VSISRRATLRLGTSTVVALLPALALGLYARRPGMAWLSLFALLPWIVLYSDDRRPRVSSLYYFVGALATWILLYPGCYQYGWFAPAFLGLVCVVWWMPFAPLLRRVHHRFGLPRAWTVPVIWVGIEWLRSEFTVGHFDLYALGYCLARFVRMIQISDLTGVYGLTFLVAAINGLFADLVFALRDRGAFGSRTRLLLSFASVVAMVFGAHAYGSRRVSDLEIEDGPRLALVQPNLPHTIRNFRGVHLSQLLMTLEEVPRGSADLIVWPENAIMSTLRDGDPYLADLRWLAENRDAALLVGALGLRDDHPGRTTNSAFLVTREGEIAGEYAKTVLFGWTEYVPLDELLGRVSPRLQRAHRARARKSWGFLASGVAGDGAVTLRLPTPDGAVPFGAMICVENAYPPLATQARRKDARFIVNITSEGEVSGPVQEQLLRISMFRAVENRVGYVRVANTGISAFIDPVGRLHGMVVGKLGETINVPGVRIGRVRVVDAPPSFYSRNGDLFAKACAALSVTLWGMSWLRRRGAAAASAAAILLAGTGCAGMPVPGKEVDNSATALQNGVRLLEAGENDEALAALTAACAEPSTCREALAPTAVAFVNTLQPENGADYLAAIEARFPEVAAEAARYRGYLLEQSLMADRAEEAYRASLDHEPTVEGFELLGKFLIHKGDLAGAIAVFERGLRTMPRTTTLHYLMGRALLERGEPAGARSHLEAALGDDPRSAPAWIALGRVYVELGDPDAARSAFLRAIVITENDVEARFHLARMALRAGDLAEARRLLGVIQGVEAKLGRGPREDE
jgi:apolipoprotein N-acyltransferase